MITISSSFNKKAKRLLLIVFTMITIAGKGLAQKTASASTEYFTIESYYKVKWGHAEEFINLWKANHYPLLKKAIEKGDIISVTAAEPKFHSGEDTRWDFRVTVVFKNVILAFEENLTTPYKKQLYPDQEAYIKAEQHRFEILLAHWDIEVGNDVLN
jgi:hypothetical protein